MRIELVPRVLAGYITAVGVGLLTCASPGAAQTAADDGGATSKRAPLASVYHEARAKQSRNRTSDGADKNNPAANVQRFLRSTTGRSLGGAAVDGVPRTARAGSTSSSAPSGLGTPSPRQVSPRDATAGEPPLPERAPPPHPTSLGTARYMNRYQATRQGLNYLEGVGVNLPGNVYAGGGYLSGTPLSSNPYYPSSGPVAPYRPFDNYIFSSPGAELYNRYWPLMLDRDADGDYQLDAVDIYFMLQGGY